MLLCLGAKNVGEIDLHPLAGWKKVICEENKHIKYYMEKCKGVIFWWNEPTYFRVKNLHLAEIESKAKTNLTSNL